MNFHKIAKRILILYVIFAIFETIGIYVFKLPAVPGSNAVGVCVGYALHIYIFYYLLPRYLFRSFRWIYRRYGITRGLAFIACLGWVVGWPLYVAAELIVFAVS